MKAARAKNQRGFTLLEMMFAMGILTVVMGVLFTLSIGIGDTAKLQDVKVVNNDESRRALIAVVPRLRQAQRTSVNWADLPGDVLSFRMAADVSGNGLAVNVSGNLEVGDLVTIRRDVDDLNGDGRTTEQLIMITGDGPPTVLANNLAPGEGEAEAGFWAEQQAGGILLTIRTEGETRRGTLIRQQFTEFVSPRN